MFQSISAGPQVADDIFTRDGIYHLRLRFPWEDQFVDIALHGVFTHADALKSFQLFCDWIKCGKLLNPERAGLPNALATPG